MIKVDHYSLQVGGFSLKNISLDIEQGEIFAILGETGSGETLLLESMAGFYEKFSGSIIYGEEKVHEIPLEERQMGFVYQDFALFPHMKVRANVEYGMRMRGKRRRECFEKSQEMSADGQETVLSFTKYEKLEFI